MKKFGTWMAAGLGAWSAACGSGCTSIQNGNSTLDSIAGGAATQSPQQAYVEAYIEFPGPQSRWAGPGTLLVHVVAKDHEVAEVLSVPEMFARHMEAAPADESRRSLASAPANAAFTQMTREASRDQLARLAAAIQDPSTDPQFAGCLSPVRVRVLRADGAILEKQGCRSSKGWPRIASELTDQFLTSVVLAEAPVPQAQPPTAPLITPAEKKAERLPAAQETSDSQHP